MSATDGYTIGGSATSTTDPLTVQNTQADRTADYLPMYSSSAVGTVAISIANLLGISSQTAAISDSQTLSNKVLDNTNVYHPKDTSLTIQNASDATKQAQFLLSSIGAGQTRIFTLPNYNGTLATVGGTETLTAKTLTAPVITNATISANSYDGYSDVDSGTIFGIQVLNGVLNSANILQTTNYQDASVTAPKMENTGTWDSSWVYTSTYVPTISSGTGTITTASATSRYKQTGKTVFATMDITITTNGTGATYVVATLPVTAKLSLGGIGFGRADIISGKQLQVKLASATTIAIYNYDGTYPGANGEILRITVIYEAL